MVLIERTRQFVADVLADEPSSHEMSHIERVESTCMAIQSEEGGDLQVIRLAALLHDVGVVKEHREGGDHAVHSAEMAYDLLMKEGVESSVVD
ncbi:MAG: HDIG domain-containing protein, partial [Methanococcoides sp.]|nr:HDIG domain-containing protein [Methanococcoides sp.]